MRRHRFQWRRRLISAGHSKPSNAQYLFLLHGVLQLLQSLQGAGGSSTCTVVAEDRAAPCASSTRCAHIPSQCTSIVRGRSLMPAAPSAKPLSSARRAAVNQAAASSSKVLALRSDMALNEATMYGMRFDALKR